MHPAGAHSDEQGLTQQKRLGGIHLERMRREAKRLPQKHRGQFRDDLLARVRSVAELRETKITV